ncbi:Glycosyl hydrolases family 2, sugar binding domain [Rubripirellula obstinata]|uniref:Glycosyl hydrolases family 2, sugar binding domain n=1 Tax=Rubripirellula obstinata TaxID=406547 RepID=A0A5B1CK02_9BACT|nr:glycosyl hydrolase [Rubripirellula obstinata]KAA1259870.1 Glycosyl hydrolases family 2, sugar binding domain [Rubripirellula obstinata]
MSVLFKMFVKKLFAAGWFLFVGLLGNLSAQVADVPAPETESIETQFQSPPHSMHPETWFHLIGGNVNKSALTTDLEAVAGAGFQGIQLFHGRGRPWPGVKPQIQTLSPTWDDMISHVADETERLGLVFTMQNCPGWAMSGGPWITPDKAMRHLVHSRTDVKGGTELSLTLPKPQPSDEPWRDYQDIAVLAFPTPIDDTGEYLTPVSVASNRPSQPWKKLIGGDSETKFDINGNDGPTWLELTFDQPTHVRCIELPPVEILLKRRNFDPDTKVRLEAFIDGAWQETGTRIVPRGTWQDRQPEHQLVLAFPDALSTRYRITFDTKHPLELSRFRLLSAARTNDWKSQAGYALRSLQRDSNPVQNPDSWVDRESIVDLSKQVDSDWRLTWNAPDGDWTVLRFGHVNTGVKNKPAPPEATGFECDKLSPAGAEQHFAGYIGRVSADGGPADQGRLKGMLIDSWECYTQTWTPAMEDEFKNRRNYDLRSWLPALAGYVIDDHQTSEMFLRDWRKTVSDMIVQNYFGRLAELARQRGMKLSFETAIGDVSPGDILEYYKSADIPMCEFWQPNDPHWGGLETKPILPAASAAHIYGKNRVAAEAFTNAGIHWNEHPFQLKHIADRHFTYGINHLVFHTYTHNPRTELVPGTSFGGRIGTPFLRGQTWWKHMPLFTDYLARCHLMLQQGNPVADVLYYLGDGVDHKPRQDEPFPTGYRFDYLNSDVLKNRISVQNGQLVTPEGIRWRVLWLPPGHCDRLSPSTLARLRDLILQGAVVIGGPPKLNPSLGEQQSEGKSFDELVSDIWGDRDEPFGHRRIGRGRLLWDIRKPETQLASLLMMLNIKPDVSGIQDGTWCHRSSEKSEIYFIAANRARPLNANLQFRATGQPRLFDPMTGKSTKIRIFDQANGFTTIPMQLPAAGSAFVVFDSGEATATATSIERDGEVVMDARASVINAEPENEFPFGLQQNDELQPSVTAPKLAPTLIGDHQMLAWDGGKYKIKNDDRTISKVDVEQLEPINLSGPWKINFPSGWGIPEQLTIDRLMPWSELPDPATRAFSGSATYSCEVQLDAASLERQLLLDLGEVSVIAAISVNGNPVAVKWAPPFRANITPHVVEGTNLIEVTVTNTWHNRLVYDANLPAAKKKTWTISGPDKNKDLVPAGMAGPVSIRVGKVIEF